MTKGNNFKKVRQVMLQFQDQFMRKAEIAEHCGLTSEQVSLIVKAVYKLGWVSRTEQLKHNNAFNKGKFKALLTAYKIKYTGDWTGYMRLYRELLEKEKLQR